MPFPQDAEWSVNLVSMGEFSAFGSYGVIGDTLIGGKSYRRIAFCNMALFDPSIANYHSALRDSIGRWYVIPADASDEYLLYDFRGEIGDTVTVQNPFLQNGFDDPVQLVVVSIDTNEFEGPERRTWQLESFVGWDEYWYEGIGSYNGLFHHLAFISDAGHALVCFHENDSLVYQFQGFSNCEWTTDIAKNFEPQYELHPSPASNQVKIDLDVPIEQVIVTDLSGRRSHVPWKESVLDVSSLPAGIYVIKIIDRDQRIHSAKLVVER